MFLINRVNFNLNHSALLILVIALFLYASKSPAQNIQGNKPLNKTQNQFSDWQTPQYILKAFQEIALKNEYKKSNKRIVKWQQPIRYRFDYQKLKRNQLVETLFKTHLKHLADITGLNIQPAINSDANLIIYLTTDKTYADVIHRFTRSTVKNIAKDSNCMGNYKTNKQNEITQAEVVLPVDHDYSRGLLVACVVEETTQVLGLPNDASWVNPSIANDDSKIELLTGLDYIFLKLLYDSKIKAGMSQLQSQRILKKEITKLINSGVVKNAAKTVNSKGLYQLVN
ncbi:DUF2927 domain-containing protein [Thiomicrorhabdus sp. Milos-T2]|uniref:DUF2927 domain-containing protein n=1 Tax=Thiomicrorhabdus sp. Milos-T2 TaxID=90814 RepID=UPI00069117BA|nr:DUF2927 domain-containing protein [Thiomicrorhabdus sp. Milos-T2]